MHSFRIFLAVENSVLIKNFCIKSYFIVFVLLMKKSEPSVCGVDLKF
jgi:hypothetical protein